MFSRLLIVQKEENVKIAVSAEVVRATLAQDETVQSAITRIQHNPQETQEIHTQLLRLPDNPASHDEAIAAHLLVLEATNIELVFKPAEFVALKTSLQWSKPLALDILNQAIDWDDDEDSPLDTYRTS